MATNFVDAVKEHTARLARAQASQPNAGAIVRAAVAAVRPVVVAIVKQNNVEVVRVLRNNPGLLGSRS